jgi:hypothetical protein
MSADLVARRYKYDFHDLNSLRAWVDEMKAQGTTWHRLHTDEKTGEMVLEGWFVRPVSDGPLP